MKNNQMKIFVIELEFVFWLRMLKTWGHGFSVCCRINGA